MRILWTLGGFVHCSWLPRIRSCLIVEVFVGIRILVRGPGDECFCGDGALAF